MAKAKNPRPPRLKQSAIPGTEPPRNKTLDAAALAYYEAIQDRLPYTAAEKEAKNNLIIKMVAAGETRYENDDLVVNLLDNKNVTCKKKKTSKPESNGKGD